MVKDWRYEKGSWLENSEFKFKTYSPLNPKNDHDHCEFCWKTFYHKIIDNYCTTEGYVTLLEHQTGIFRKKIIIQDHWVCKECFNDFKDTLNLKIKNN